MAKNRIEETSVHINVTGVEEALALINKVSATTKSSLKMQEKELDLIGKKKKEIEAEINHLKSVGLEYREQEKQLARVSKQYEKQETIVKRYQRQVAQFNKDTLIEKVLSEPLKATGAQVKQVQNILKTTLQTLGPENVKEAAAIGGALKQLEAVTRANERGIKDLTSALGNTATKFTELDNIVKNYEVDGRALAATQENQAETYRKLGARATDAKVQIAELDGTLVKLSSESSKEGLEKTAAWFKQMQQYSGASAEQVRDFGEKYKQAMSLLAQKNQEILQSPQRFSVNEVQGALRWMQEYQKNTVLSEAEQRKLNESILQGSQYVKEFSEKAQYGKGGAVWKDMASQLQNIKSISREALNEQQKYWQAVQDKAKATSQEYETAKVRLQSVNEELSRRKTLEVQQQGQSIVGQVNSGAFNKTIQETQQAIEKLKEYRATLQAKGGEDAIKAVDEAITKLNRDLLMTNEEVMKGKAIFDDYSRAINGDTEALKQFNNLESKGAAGLNQMRASLEAYKKTLKWPEEAEQLKRVETLLIQVDRAQKNLNASSIEWSKYKGDELKKRSLTELRNAYDALKKQIEAMSPAQQDYNEKAMQMRSIDERVKSLNKSMGHHVSQLENAASRLKNYVMIYLGFNKVMQMIQKGFRNTVELSDMMTNVQKVAGLTADEIGRMTTELQKFDTRSTTPQLMEIAEQAAKLGVAAQGGADAIVQFVRAGEQITNTLGSDVGAEAISDLLKVNDLLNKNSQGIERDLLKVGSAILNVGNNSKASYSHVLDFTRTMGAVGSVTGLTMEQVIALGGTFDSLGGNIDSSATAIQRVLMGLNTNTADVAKAVHMSISELQQLIEEKGSLAALQEALMHIKNEGVVGVNNLLTAIGGRNNVQARAAMSLLIENLDVLNYQIRLAERGYADGMIVTNEYNKANDNLAGTMKRVENEFYEFFSNNTAVNFFTPLAKVLLSIAKLFNSSATAGAAFAAAISFLVVQLIMATTRIGAVRAALLNFGNQIVFAGKGVKELTVYLIAKSAALFRVKGAADQATAAMNRLKAASMTNWITALVTVVASLVTYFVMLGREISNTTKAAYDMIKAHNDEEAVLIGLNTALMNNINNEQEKTRLIDEFNSKFGGYLTNLLDEKSTVDEIALAYRQAANAIREKNAAQILNEARPKAIEAHQEELEEASEGIRDIIATGTRLSRRGLSQEEQERFINDIERAVSENVEKQGLNATTNSVYEAVKEVLDKTWQTKGGASLVDEARSLFSGNKGAYVKDLIDAQIAVQKTYSTLETQGKLLADNTKNLREELKMETDNIIKQTKAYNEGNKDGYDFSTLIRQLERAIEVTKKLGDKATATELKNLETFQQHLVTISKNTKVYGIPATTWEQMNGEQLKEVMDRLENIMKNYNPGANISQAFQDIPGLELPKGISNWQKDDIIKWAKENFDKAKKIQKELNFANRNASFINDKDGGGTSKEQQEMKKEMDATLAKLEEYYERRQMMAEKARNEGMIGEDEYNRYLFANEQEHLQERQNLRRKWLDSDKDFLTEGVRNLMSDVNFDRLSKFLTDKGQAMVDGIKLNIAKDENAFEKNIRENREKIEKILLDERPIAKVAEAFVSDLAELRVLWSDADKAVLNDSNEAQRLMMAKVSFLMEEAKKGYKLTREELIKDMRNNPMFEEWADQFNEWADQLSSPENQSALDAIVLKTQGFFDEYEDAVKKMISKISKRIEHEWKMVGPDGKSIEQRFADATKEIERKQELQGMADSWGLTGYNIRGVGDSDKLEIEMLNKKVELEKERYELVKQRMEEEYNAILMNAEASKKAAAEAREKAEELRALAESDPDKQKEFVNKRREAAEREKESALLFQEAETMKEASLRATAEAFENLKSAQDAATMGQIKLMDKTVSMVKPYYDNLMSFAENFGENIFGKKEDRQQAARDLLANLITTTGQMLTQWLVYLVTRNSYEKMYSAQSLAIRGQEELGKLTMDTAIVAKDAAKAQAHEAGKSGWIGWATGAALSVLMTTMFAAIAAKVRSTVSSVTGESGSSGKLATGMLTYAKGRYPTYSDGTMNVQGNDGNTYHATYQPNLQTGEYSTPHLGIVGEKGAELIVDSPTYKNIQRYRPDILDDIYRIHRYGTRRVDWGEAARRGNEVLARRAGVRTFADGNVEEVIGSMGDTQSNKSQEALVRTLATLNTVLDNIQQQGISAHMNLYGNGGAQSAVDKANRFMKKVGKS